MIYVTIKFMLHYSLCKMLVNKIANYINDELRGTVTCLI